MPPLRSAASPAGGKRIKITAFKNFPYLQMGQIDMSAYLICLSLLPTYGTRLEWNSSSGTACTVSLKPFHIFRVRGDCFGILDVKTVICPCLWGSAWTPRRMSAQSPTFVTSAPAAHALVYDWLPHTPVQLLQRQLDFLKSFLWVFFYPDLLSVMPVSLCCQQSF